MHSSLKGGAAGLEQLAKLLEIFGEKVSADLAAQKATLKALLQRHEGVRVLQVTHDISHLTCADVLRAPGVQTPVIVRFSTVIHERGSPETLRDPRGFAVRSMGPLLNFIIAEISSFFLMHEHTHLMEDAYLMQVKFYTREGNWDLVGNNFPVRMRTDLRSTEHSCLAKPALHVGACAARGNLYTGTPSWLIAWLCGERPWCIGLLVRQLMRGTLCSGQRRAAM